MSEVQYRSDPGYVYVWHFDVAPAVPGIAMPNAKVGMSTRDAAARVRASIRLTPLRAIATAAGIVGPGYAMPYVCAVTSHHNMVVNQAAGASAFDVEQAVHKLLDHIHIHIPKATVSAAYGHILRSGRTEFFAATVAQAVAAIKCKAHTGNCPPNHQHLPNVQTAGC